MGKTMTMKPKAVLTFANTVYTKMNGIYSATNSLYTSVKKFESSGVWTGQTAYGWAVKAHQNCHNGIARLNNFAKYMGALCDSAAEHAGADGKATVQSDLSKLAGKFESLCSNCETLANSIKKGQ